MWTSEKNFQGQSLLQLWVLGSTLQLAVLLFAGYNPHYFVLLFFIFILSLQLLLCLLARIKYSFITCIYFLLDPWVCMLGGGCQSELEGVGSFISPYGFPESSSGHQTWQQVPYPTELLTGALTIFNKFFIKHTFFMFIYIYLYTYSCMFKP